MTDTPYVYYFLEATKITFFCLLIAGIFKLMGVSTDTLLIVFNMAVMSAAATFSPVQKKLDHILLGSIVIVISIVLGGLVGFYFPISAKFLTIIYAGLAFLVPKTKNKNTIFVTGAVMFLIFASLPFNYHYALRYFLCGLIVIIFFGIIVGLANLKTLTLTQSLEAKLENNTINALMAVTALSLGWLISFMLSTYTTISHLYWIGLTILVILQGSQQKNISTAIKRILINLCGALIVVILFNYVIPSNFWINFILLTVFLFLIFALGFSYIWRTLFIEMFVLGFTHLLGSYHDIIAIDRIILTIIGGMLVILTTLLYRFLVKSAKIA